MKHPALLAIGWLALAAPAMAAPTVTVDSLIERALRQAPALHSSQNNARAQEAQIGVAQAPYYPQLTLSAGSQRTTTLVAGQQSSMPIDYSTGGLGMSWDLFNFGKTQAAVDVAKANAQVSRANVQLTAVTIAYNVRQAYFQWIEALALVDSDQEQVDNAQHLLDQARAFFKAGHSPYLDVTTADVTLQQARAALVAAKSQSLQAQRALAIAVGQTQPIAGQPVFPPTPALANTPLPQLENQALSGHPSAQAAIARLRSAQASREEAERNGSPDLAATGSLGGRATELNVYPSWNAGLNVSWPIFTGFALTRQRESARALEAAAANDLTTQEQQIVLGVDRAYLSLVAARDSLVATQAALKSARENLRQANGRYRAGVGSIVEVSQAQSLLASSEANLAQTNANYQLAIAALLQSLGTTGVTP